MSENRESQTGSASLKLHKTTVRDVSNMKYEHVNLSFRRPEIVNAFYYATIGIG